MASFLARRLLQSVLSLLGVLTATFFLVRLAGDPTDRDGKSSALGPPTKRTNAYANLLTDEYPPFATN